MSAVPRAAVDSSLRTSPKNSRGEAQYGDLAVWATADVSTHLPSSDSKRIVDCEARTSDDRIDEAPYKYEALLEHLAQVDLADKFAFFASHRGHASKTRKLSHTGRRKLSRACSACTRRAWVRNRACMRCLSDRGGKTGWKARECPVGEENGRRFLF